MSLPVAENVAVPPIVERIAGVPQPAVRQVVTYGGPTEHDGVRVIERHVIAGTNHDGRKVVSFVEIMSLPMAENISRLTTHQSR